MDDRYMALASLAVARELYDSEKSIYDVLKNYEELITNKNEELLYKLYIEKHKFNNDKSADFVSWFAGDYS